MTRTRPPSSRCFATVLVLWAVGISSIVLVSLQSSAWRQTAAGREAIGRVRAHWAARAGIEATIATLAADTLSPSQTDAFETKFALEAVSAGKLAGGGSYWIRHTEPPNEYDGPEDAHAKINVSAMTRDDLLTFLDMGEDAADSILDWIDEDDDVRELGAEVGYYFQGRTFRYEPRNAPIRTMQELELVSGCDASLVRGEDWNLNGILDPNEDDGDVSWPPDNADGILNSGWSEHLTAYSVDGGYSMLGEAKLDLRTAEVGDIAKKADLDRDQADAVAAWAARSNSTMVNFLQQTLRQLATQAQASQSARQARELTDDQLAFLLDSFYLDDSTVPPKHVGRLNINTCSRETLEHVAGIDPVLADVILLERDARPQGFLSVVDLLEVPAINRARLATLYPLLCVRSNVYVVNCRGRDENTGLEVEMTAVLDRSTLPVTIRDMVVK
ncbi:MAG: helix-hairpin-helix domain-containing protein [Phycisphaerales bacterium]